MWMDGNSGFAIAGVFRSIRHMEALLELLEYHSRPGRIDFPDWGTLRQAVYATHRWRFDLQQETYYDKFLNLARVLFQAMKSDAAVSLNLPTFVHISKT